jgi:hypothetical protein
LCGSPVLYELHLSDLLVDISLSLLPRFKNDKSVKADQSFAGAAACMFDWEKPVFCYRAWLCVKNT